MSSNRREGREGGTRRCPRIPEKSGDTPGNTGVSGVSLESRKHHDEFQDGDDFSGFSYNRWGIRGSEWFRQSIKQLLSESNPQPPAFPGEAPRSK